MSTTLNPNHHLSWRTITGNGTLILGSKLNRVSNLLILLSGTFDTASLQVSYKNVAGVFVPFVGVVAILAAKEVSVEIGKGMIIGIVATHNGEAQLEARPQPMEGRDHLLQR